MKAYTKEEFDALNPDEQKQVIQAMKDLEAAVNADAGDDKDLTQLSMKDFKALIDDQFKKAIEPMTKVDRKFFAFPGIGNPGDGLDAESKFVKTVKFMKALVGGDVETATNISKEVAQKANLSEGSATEGGFLVPEEFQAEILRLAPLYGVIRGNVRVVPMARDIQNWPAAGGTQLDALFVGEGGTIKSTDPNFRQVVLTINKLAAIPKVTNELLADANVDTISYLSELIAESFAKKEDDQGLNGIGSPFTGILVATGVPTTPHAGGTGIICLSYADLVSAEGDVYDTVLSNAKWLFHRTVVAHIRSRITTTGAPIFDSATKEILGWPVIRAEMAPGVRHANAKVDATAYALFGDLRRAMMLGQRGGMTMKISDVATVGGDNTFEQDMSAVRVIERIAMSVALPSSVTRLVT